MRVKRLIFLLIILIITIVSITGYLSYSIFYYNNARSALLYFPKNTPTKVIAHQLEYFSVINNAKIFMGISYLTRIIDKKNLQNGEYAFEMGSTMLSVLKKMIKGDRYIRKITIPEGLTNYQIDNILNNSIGLTKGNYLVTSLEEGTLMPDTYYYYFEDSKDSIIDKMSVATVKFMDKHRNTNKNPNLLKTDQEILILASIIEKETSKKEEMPIIASVYINRMKIGMLLQADPTVIYALSNKTGELGRALAKNDLKTDSPYNTYKYNALPPSAIAAPSRAAILAALNPSDTDYLYFVADGNGGHRFANSLNEHNKNVTAFRLSKN